MDSDNDQTSSQNRGITRKTLLKGALIAAPVPLLVGQMPALARAARESGQPLVPTPFCDDGDDPTISQTEGPYFTPGSPLRDDIAGGAPGTRLTVTGYVFGLACQPLAGALLDFWQADTYGRYDNVGYNFRGHQFSEDDGSFRLTTIVPGLYPGRTRHIHVKLQAPGHPVLTTQLYFPGEPRNRTDTIFDPRLLMDVGSDGSGRTASYDFVLRVQGEPDPPDTTPPPDTPPPSGTWQVGTAYQIGDQVTYNGASYRCRQAHTALPGWEPPNVPALWLRL